MVPKLTSRCYVVTGASGTLGSALIKLIKAGDEEAPVLEVHRCISVQNSDPSKICIDLARLDLSALNSALTFIEPYDTVVLVHLAAEHNTDLDVHEIFNVNYFSVVKLCEIIEAFCLKTQSTLQCVFALSGTAFSPEVQKPGYSASKAALYNYVKYRLKIKSFNSITCGIFLGPFKSDLWDENRMTKWKPVTQTFRRCFSASSKAEIIFRKIEKKHSGLYIHPTVFISIAVSIRQFLIRR